MHMFDADKLLPARILKTLRVAVKVLTNHRTKRLILRHRDGISGGEWRETRGISRNFS